MLIWDTVRVSLIHISLLLRLEIHFDVEPLVASTLLDLKRGLAELASLALVTVIVIIGQAHPLHQFLLLFYCFIAYDLALTPLNQGSFAHLDLAYYS